MFKYDVLVSVSVLVYVDKNSVKASNNVKSNTNTIDNQVESAMDSFDEVSVKGNSTIYKMKVKDDKITFNVTETATGRKILQTSEKNNQYTEVNLDNGKLSVTAGEIKDGKYVAKNSGSGNLEEEAKKIQQEKAANSNRVSCITFGKSLWYEKDDSNVNIGKSRFGKDLERKSIELSNLNEDDSKNINSYQSYVDNSSKNWLKATENFNVFLDEIYGIFAVAYIEYILYLITEVVAMAIPVLGIPMIIISVVLTLLMLPKLFPLIKTPTVAFYKSITNSVKALNNGMKAQKMYKKIAYLGKAY